MNEKIAEYQRAFLLLQALGSEDRQVSLGEANKAITGGLKKALELTPATANKTRDELVKEGYLEKSKQNRTVYFRLTDRGLALLLALEQYPASLTVSGRALNALVSAVREQSASWTEFTGNRRLASVFDELQRGLVALVGDARDRASIASTASPTSHALPARKPESLEKAILAEFSELRRERFGHSGLVPIHEVRKRIAEKYGADSARHDTFDPEVQRLRQQNRLRLVPISDLRDATKEELNASIPGVNETLFYLESAHELVGR